MLRRQNIVATAVAVALTLGLVLTGLLISVHIPATNGAFYRRLWEEYQVPSDTGMSLGDLSAAGTTLIAYLTGKEDTPQIRVTIFGEERPLYGERELTHLEDVRRLFQGGIMIERASASIAALGTALLILSGNHRKASRAFLVASLLSLALVVFLAVGASSDFGDWWTSFHLIAFTNDLWILDPGTHWLIRMFPEGFFYSMAVRSGVGAMVTAATLAAVGFVLGRRPHWSLR